MFFNFFFFNCLKYLLTGCQAMFQLARAVRQMLDYRTEDINGIPGLHFNTDDNAHAGNRIQCVPVDLTRHTNTRVLTPTS